MCLSIENCTYSWWPHVEYVIKLGNFVHYHKSDLLGTSSYSEAPFFFIFFFFFFFPTNWTRVIRPYSLPERNTSSRNFFVQFADTSLRWGTPKLETQCKTILLKRTSGLVALVADTCWKCRRHFHTLMLTRSTESEEAEFLDEGFAEVLNSSDWKVKYFLKLAINYKK
jgi:hypothetical protein